VSAAALALALAAAVVHAVWNLLLAREEDTAAATAVLAGVGVVAFAPAAALTWRVESEALPWIGASAVFELAYLVLLAAAYGRAELSFVYPIARGTAPVIVLAVSVGALGVGLSAGAVVGVIAIALGVLVVRGARRPGSGRDLALALGVAVTIAGFTLVDNEGLRHAAPIPYLELVLILAVGAYAGWLVARGGLAPLRAALSPATAVAGVGVFGGYALTLGALAIAAAAPVAAARESSVVVAAVLAAVFLDEPMARVRIAGAALVAGGIAAIALL
jgi:drug/metabolite transporter (DMT)-like permease